MSVRTLQISTSVFLGILIAVLFGGTTLALAQESTGATDTEEISSSTTVGSSADSAAAEEPVAEVPPAPIEKKPALQIQGQKRITNLAANMSNRMDSIVYRMQNVVARLKTRLAILESENINTGAARAELAEAETKISIASNALKTIDANVAAFVGSENPREAWIPVRNTFGTIRDALLGAHAGLQSTLDTMKAASVVPPAALDEDTTTATGTEEITE